ncbi:Fe2OG dioxygenase domain-containing protein [Citrus sinensis]|nr:Fe2OG dioxygenase domain-containing protein [Citrus sinensis]
MDPEVGNGCVQEDEELGWGKSLPVPSVQEIVRNDSLCVPERYIQERQNRPDYHSEVSYASSEIPVINMSLLANGDKDELRKFDIACKEWGFFQITNHGIAETVIHNMKDAIAAFFQLPFDEKKKYTMPANDVQGYGQGYVVSEQQKLDWSDVLFLVTLPPSVRNLKLWPVALPGFKESIDQYSTEIRKVTEEIFAKLSLLMGMDTDGLKMLHGEMKQATRMNYYPTCSRPELVLGVSPHSDASTITLLLQDDKITGLQIKHKDSWIPVKPIPDAIVVNIGDVAEVLSNGLYKSVEHRAVTNDKKARMSVATFVIPSEEVEIGPLESMVDDKQFPRMYRNMKYVDYLRHTLERKMDGKAHTEYLKL